MEKREFNKNWTCRCITRKEPEIKVTLPHDAMRSEARTEESQGEGNIGWYIGGDYEYTKSFFVPAEDVDKKAVLEHPEVKKAIAEVTEALGSDGRILVRESGTEPLLRVMVEATTQELCKEYVGKVIDTMKRIM